MRSIEDVIRIKQRKQFDLQAKIKVLEAALRIVSEEPEEAIVNVIPPNSAQDHETERAVKRFP